MSYFKKKKKKKSRTWPTGICWGERSGGYNQKQKAAASLSIMDNN